MMDCCQDVSEMGLIYEMQLVFVFVFLYNLGACSEFKLFSFID